MGRKVNWKLEFAFFRVLIAQWLLPKEFAVYKAPKREPLCIEGEYERI